jgi:hypothetical protein
MSNHAVVKQFRIGFPDTYPLLECRGVEFEKVEKIEIEADRQIVIVLNLADKTEPNLVNDSPNMGDAPSWTFDSSDTACSLCGLPNPSCTSSRKDSIVVRGAMLSHWLTMGGYHGTTTRR